MSTRYMKRIYGGNAIREENNEAASDTEVSVTNDTKSKSFNVFDVLSQSSDNDEQDTSDKQDNEDLVASDGNENCNDMKRKKKKKKRRKPENIKNQQLQQHDVESNDSVDEVERSIWEVNKLLGEPSVAGCSNQILEPQWINNKSKEDVLIVQHKHLNPYNELKRIFGSKTVEAEQSKTRNRGRSGHLRKTWLVSPRDNWPPLGKFGLTMSFDHGMDDTGNAQYFVYQHSSSYKQIQLKFLRAVESLNPENIISIINAHPYHVDALLQTSELCNVSEDLAMAAEFAERALYSLECAFHPSFNLTTTQCRLDYRKQQNRALFIVLFKHLGFVGGRACYRTSLEFCKLLLSLDHADPLAVILFIDFYALRAREYKWFVEFCNLWESSRNLSQLPNIAYSLALAHFHLGNKADADNLLQNALIMFPGVLALLLEKCSIQTDAKVMYHAFFNSRAQASTPPALEKLQNLYVLRSFHLWKEADILPWLKECVHAVLNRVESKDDYVKFCDVKRGKRYQGRLPKNILRHIILADLKEVTVIVQEVHNENPVLSHDPLPPTDSIDIYRRPTMNTRAPPSSSNFVSLFFSSLFTNLDDETAAAALNGLNLFEENDDHA
ncbi:hypothetical protein DMN91_000628 [Ooceraea biroi]|uniref:Transcription factor n=1 Tax=Ooceraea biroi TaxID=2015173 RepID=A0A026W7A5_OOCBI|nr:transcription factor 25 [Ooceraea biroi]EZA51501.1 Transcription factor [Ooceraea biroi]RLU26831.1 hypothetical protein DMN91_000628 [Ooceraea biroi]